MKNYASRLADRCAGHAQNLSLNGETEQLKRVLLDASHFIDTHNVVVHRKRDGLLLQTTRGKARFMTLRERLAYWLLRERTEIAP